MYSTESHSSSQQVRRSDSDELTTMVNDEPPKDLSRLHQIVFKGTVSSGTLLTNARNATQLMTDELGKHTQNASARRLAPVERKISEVVESAAQLDLSVGRVTFEGAKQDQCRQIIVSAVRLRREAAQAGWEVQATVAKQAKKNV